VAQGDAHGLARKIVDVMDDAERYERLSSASVGAARRAASLDFARLYSGVVTGTLAPEFSPEPTLGDARRLLGLMVFFAERSHRRGRASAADGSAVGARLWGSAAPIGRAALRRLPGLRPLAHRAKQWLRLG
jgi:hypothetical protein